MKAFYSLFLFLFPKHQRLRFDHCSDVICCQGPKSKSAKGYGWHFQSSEQYADGSDRLKSNQIKYGFNMGWQIAT